MQEEKGKKSAGCGNLSEEAVFPRIARALARGYTDLFCVIMDTGEFVEYRTDDSPDVLTEVRRGNDFFESCEREAKRFVHPEDQAAFVHAMNRDRLTAALETSGVFEMTYRRIKGGAPFQVRMKVTRMERDRRFIVVAVSDIEEITRRRRAEERIREERTVYARLQALTGNYIVVYVVDPETDGYREFTATEEYQKSFARARDGADFFSAVRKAAARFSHPEDRDRFLSAFTKENVLAETAGGGLFTLGFRIRVKGRLLHVRLTAAMVEEEEGRRLVVGLSDNEAQFRHQEAEKEIERQKDIYDQVASCLAERYDTLYYVDLENSTYHEMSVSDEFRKLNVPAAGNDFFAESRRSIRRFVHPDDREKVLRIHYRDAMLESLLKRGSFSFDYRMFVSGKLRYIRQTDILARDQKHIVVCVRDIDSEIRESLAREADRERNVTFTRIAETLASHYDLIYYINCETSRYSELSSKRISGELKVQEEGKNFFTTARKNADRLVHAEDRERIRLFLDRDSLISRLETRRQLIEDYRMILAGGKTRYARMTVTYSSDRSHFIICVENREEDVRREQEQLAALSMANLMARRDELTHTKNLTAYHEMEKELQAVIDGGGAPFGIVVCDINGLKAVNDTEGHKAGDDYIRASCTLICRVFQHSPVFRVGGDEFVVILRDQDYINRDNLVTGLRRQVEENVRSGEGPVVAAGLAEFQPLGDHSVEDVFNRADSLMYEDKTQLKKLQLIRENRSLKEKANVRMITGERRSKLDSLFTSFEVVSEGTYVFLCDMKYDYSRWSKTAVDAFGLPSEYMYGAGDLWENRIHPEDRAAYHKGIEDIFSGNVSGHDMQYRARRVTGEYDVCTCRGIVIRNADGEADYFAGSIRNHGVQGHVDTLTGLRNQYGFFEDLESFIRRNAEARVILFGIGRFSEINEMYGYQFGNRVLQAYARKVFETTGNTGGTYRIDGTKFAVISSTLSIAQMREKYDGFRAFLHEGFVVEGRKILLDLQCGALNVNNFDVDSQTAYACLNFAYEESKARKKGEMVEFRSELNGDSHLRLEMLHDIRASIIRGFEGFFLLFQPVVDARTERIIGAEALLRWKSDRFGTVPPDQFIPVLEFDPAFPDLGEWVLREAVQAAGPFLDRIRGFVVNVNLSYSQLEKPDFVDMVLRILEETGFPPGNLCLEFTERCRTLDMELLKSAVASLKSRGIQVALDDFGTGFSSVGLIREIPFDSIKIDRTFVQKIEEEETERRVIQTIIDLASIFGAQVCVEGIETKGMRNVLKHFRVKSFQGYYYSKPVPPGQIAEWRKP